MVPNLKTLRRLAVGALVLTAALFVTAAGARSLAAPASTSAPTIEGKLFVGQTLTTNGGLWTTTPTKLTYQWLRCDKVGTGCAPIAGATSASYKLTNTDVGGTMVVLVTASNGDGSSGAVNSKPSALVSAATAPKNKVPPAIVGDALVGVLLFADPGTYTAGIPDKFTFQWQSCKSNGTACTDVSGQTSQTYTIRGTDVDRTLRVAVKASNDYGSDVTTTDRTAVVKTAPVPVAVTTSMTASKTAVTCCAAALLNGTVSTAKAGELLTILALPYGELAARPIGTATTTTGGVWTFSVRPSIKTMYQAKTASSTGPARTIGVHPRVGLGYQLGVFSTKVTGGAGATSFAGKIVLFQRRNASGSWVTLDKVVVNLTSQAKFRVKLPSGASYTRVFLTRVQAGEGYLNGVSTIRRFTRP